MKALHDISVIVPAHNESRYLPLCLQAIQVASAFSKSAVETVVVANRCTDDTESMALRFGATLVKDESRCIAAIRNRGVRAASGSVVVTCDADSRLHPQTFRRAIEELERGAVGGGVDVVFDRRSVGIRITESLLRLAVRATGVSAGAFWTTREAFDDIGGFDERLVMAEDYDFARRLKAFGKARQARYRTLWDAPLTTSSRKFDRFGDWSFLRMLTFDAARIRRSLKRQDTEFVDEYFYDFNDLPATGKAPLSPVPRRSNRP